jgi:hypothetical protein
VLENSWDNSVFKKYTFKTLAEWTGIDQILIQETSTTGLDGGNLLWLLPI